MQIEEDADVTANYVYDGEIEIATASSKLKPRYWVMEMGDMFVDPIWLKIFEHELKKSKDTQSKHVLDN